MEKTKQNAYYLEKNQKANESGSPGIRYGTIQIKHYDTVTYLGRALDEDFSEETLVLNVTSKLTVDLGFCTEKNRLLSYHFRRLFCNGLMQAYFDYGSSTWYPNLNN